MNIHGYLLVWSVMSAVAMAYLGYTVPRSAHNIRFARRLAYHSHDGAQVQRVGQYFMNLAPFSGFALALLGLTMAPFVIYRMVRVLIYNIHFRPSV